METKNIYYTGSNRIFQQMFMGKLLQLRNIIAKDKKLPTGKFNKTVEDLAEVGFSGVKKSYFIPVKDIREA